MLAYHGGKPYIETVLNKDGNFWINAHIVFAVVSIVVIAVHLILHLSWFKKLFSGKLKNKFRIKNLILVIIFLLATITSLIPWLFMDNSKEEDLLLGIHNKLGLILIIFFIIHIINYFGWLVNMTKRVFGNS